MSNWSSQSRWTRACAFALGLFLVGCSLRDLDGYTEAWGLQPDAGLAPDAADPAGPDGESAPPDGEQGVLPDAAVLAPDTATVAPDGGTVPRDSAPVSRDTSPGPDVPPAALRTLYWVDSDADGVWAAATDGTGKRRLVQLPAASFPRSIAVDGVNRKLYFSDSGLKKVMRANLDGSGLQDVAVGLDAPVGLDVDPVAGKLYFADQGMMPAVFRCNLDGSGREAIITTGLKHPYGLVVDRGNARLYFVDNEVDVIFRASLDGKVVERIMVPGLAAPIELALDSQEGRLYWSDLGPPPRVRRVKVDGTGVEDVINMARSPNLSTPLGVTVDVRSRQLYYVDGGTGMLDIIRRAQLDGSDIRPIVDGLSSPRGLTIGD